LNDNKAQENDANVGLASTERVLGNEMVGHLPCEFSQIGWYFLARSGKINVEVISPRQHCKIKQTAPLGATTFTKSRDQQQVSICLLSLFTEGFHFNP